MAQQAVSQPEPWGAVLWFIDCSFHSSVARDDALELHTVPSAFQRHMGQSPTASEKAEASSSHLPLPISPLPVSSPHLPLAWK